jgi:hypothetical protein
MEARGEVITGWDNIAKEIKSELEQTKELLITTINMNSTSELPKSILEEIKDKKVQLKLDMGEEIAWIINGNGISEIGSLSIDLKVRKDTDSIPSDVIDGFVKDRMSSQIDLSHNGAFGFEVTLIFTVDAQNAGRYSNLYYYNETTRELEFVESSEIDETGKINLLFHHASSYVIIIDSESMEQSVATASSEKIEENSKESE